MPSRTLRAVARYTPSRVKSLLRSEFPQIPAAFDHHDQSTAAWSVVKDQTMLPEIRVRMLYELAAHCEHMGLPGDFVECGVWKGGAVATMAIANLQHGRSRRKLHLFDAFDNICEPDPTLDGPDVIQETVQVLGRTDFTGRLTAMPGAYDHLGGHGTVEACRRLLCERVGYPEDLVEFHVGWFQHTVPPVSVNRSIQAIALLRLDGDYYASTRTCLDGLFDLVVPGGVVIIDDYGAYEGCRRAVHDFFDERGLRPFLHYTDHICRYWIKT
jgi:O-methyltransferase